MGTRAKAALLALAAVVAGVILVWKLAPDRRPAEQQILETLMQIQKAVEGKSLRGTMRHVSESYRDSDCENKRELTQLAVGGFQERGDFHLVLQAGRPDVQGSRASLDIQVDFSVDKGQSLHRVQPFTVHTQWAREKGKWKITRAEGYWEASEALEPGA